MTTTDPIQHSVHPDFTETEATALFAIQTALAHVQELREAWTTGALSEHDGKGGTRSNRNVYVEGLLNDIMCGAKLNAVDEAKARVARNKFRVGDRVIDTLILNQGVAEVTEITARGFAHKLETPHHLGPFMGTTTGGEVCDASKWRLA